MDSTCSLFISFLQFYAQIVASFLCNIAVMYTTQLSRDKRCNALFMKSYEHLLIERTRYDPGCASFLFYKCPFFVTQSHCYTMLVPNIVSQVSTILKTCRLVLLTVCWPLPRKYRMYLRTSFVDGLPPFSSCQTDHNFCNPYIKIDQLRNTPSNLSPSSLHGV